MKLAIRSLAAAAALVCLVPAASADVLTFDDLTGTQFFSGPYQGFTFASVSGPVGTPGTAGSWYHSDSNTGFGAPYYTSANTSLSTDYNYDANGSPLVQFGESLAISSATPIVFNGAYFQTLDNDIDIQFNLYLNNVLVGTSANIVVDAADPATFLSSGYTGLVDKITVTSWHGYFALDNLTFNANVVPEPSSYALLGLGLAAMAGVSSLSRRRRG